MSVCVGRHPIAEEDPVLVPDSIRGGNCDHYPHTVQVWYRLGRGVHRVSISVRYRTGSEKS